MTHLRQPFPAHLGALSARTIADRLRAAGIPATCAGPHEDAALTHLDRLEGAAPGGLVFVRTAQHARLAQQLAPGALLGSAEALRDAAGCALVIVPDADRAVLALLHLMMPPPAHEPAGAHASSVVHPEAVVESSAIVGPQCLLERGAHIGQGARLIGQVYVGAGASVGAATVLYPGVRILDNCSVGKRCILHAGVVIGADGFGYAPREDGRGLAKVPHVGSVVIEDDVEIGANSCVDRAKFGATRVGQGTKIDNLVQVGHNCDIGRSCILCGEVGLAGSVTLGDGVILGGRSGIADNVVIGSGARIAAYSAVSNDVPPGATYMGIPARPAEEARRTFAALRKLGKRSE